MHFILWFLAKIANNLHSLHSSIVQEISRRYETETCYTTVEMFLLAGVVWWTVSNQAYALHLTSRYRKINENPIFISASHSPFHPISLRLVNEILLQDQESTFIVQVTRRSKLNSARRRKQLCIMFRMKTEENLLKEWSKDNHHQINILRRINAACFAFNTVPIKGEIGKGKGTMCDDKFYDSIADKRGNQ